MKKLRLLFATGCCLIFAIGVIKCVTFKSGAPSVPMVLSPSSTPLVITEISGKKYHLLLDLGAYDQLVLNQEILGQSEKEAYGETHWMDFKGNRYKSNKYLLPQIKIGGVRFVDVFVKEDSEAYRKSVTLWTDPDDDPIRWGNIGRAFLRRMNCLLMDFPKLKMYFNQPLTDLQQEGYQIDNFVSLPVEITRNGIILEFETDIGPKKFILDTGSTITLVKAPLIENRACSSEDHGILYFTTSKFAIGGKDFGNMRLHQFESFSDSWDVDGVLGMDFLKNHVIIIDFRSKVVYID